MVLRQDERSQVRYRFGKCRCDGRDPIAREEEGAQTRAKREIGEGGDVVVGKVDCILVLIPHSKSFNASVSFVSGNWPIQLYFALKGKRNHNNNDNSKSNRK